jgi:hypothetical protein
MHRPPALSFSSWVWITPDGAAEPKVTSPSEKKDLILHDPPMAATFSSNVYATLRSQAWMEYLLNFTRDFIQVGLADEKRGYEVIFLYMKFIS